MREEIPALLGGERLDRIVSMLCDISRTAATALIDDGDVRVDGAVVTTRSARVATGSIVEAPDATVVAGGGVEAEPDVPLTVIHADDDVIVVDKPAGLIVHPGAGHPTGTLVNAVLARFPEVAGVGDPARPGVVHRLDKGTSGLLAVARSEAGYTGLVAQLSARTVSRAYDTLVWGIPDSTAGLVDAPIGRSKREPTRMAIATGGREARTRYEVIESFRSPDRLSHLVCRLETGRTHQIRVHLEAIGHPVVGDRRYGGARTSLPLDRPFLHAAHLGFTHPVTGDELAFDAALPADLAKILLELRAADG